MKSSRRQLLKLVAALGMSASMAMTSVALQSEELLGQSDPKSTQGQPDVIESLQGKELVGNIGDKGAQVKSAVISEEMKAELFAFIENQGYLTTKGAHNDPRGADGTCGLAVVGGHNCEKHDATKKTISQLIKEENAMKQARERFFSTGTKSIEPFIK